jgi:hypothetical protein
MEDELEELKCDIRKTKADLEQAQRDGDRELQLKFADILRLLLKEKERLATGNERIPTSLAVLAPPVLATSGLLHRYHCRLFHARHLKCFRANVYKIAEENLAFVRDAEDSGDGIKCDAYDIDIDLVFKEESWMLKFQSALLRIAGNTTSNKKPRITEESKGAREDDSDEDEEEENDLEDQKRDNNFDIEIHDQLLSTVPLETAIKRVFYYDYLHVARRDEAPNSPQCDTFSDAGSMSIYEPETVTLSIERVGQMIEDLSHPLFIGKNPEIAHIKDKAKSKPTEKNDENNHLYLSRPLHEAFDGINTQPSGFPWFLIHYHSHQEQFVDYGALQRIFGNDLIVNDRTKRYHLTIVHIEFYNLVQANVYLPYLRNGCRRVDPNDSLIIQMELYFSDPIKAKKYLNWKEKKTSKIWGR